MADEIVSEFEKAKAAFKADVAVLGTDAAKVKAWYKAFPFYAGLIVGAVAAVATLHFL